MNEFMNLLAEAIRAKADQDGVCTIKDFFSEQSNGEEYINDLHLRVSADGFITFQEGGWTEFPLTNVSFGEVKQIAHILGV